jgi:DNA-binding response OmpR family regulator
MFSINIIIVEDNIALRQSLEEFLSSEGMLVRGVESGEELDR